MAFTDPSSVLGTLLGGGLLGYEALNMNKALPGVNALMTGGQNMMNVGNTLTAQGLGGPLLGWQRGAVQQATDAQIAAQKQQFAHMGLSNSTMAVQAQNAVRDQSAALEGEMSMGLLKQGLAATGVGVGEVEDAIKIYGTQLADFEKSMMSFSRALAGGSPGG